MITIDQFKEANISIGTILSAEKVPDTDKLLKLAVSFGEETRQVISGIATHIESPESIIGIQCAFVTNLEPRVIRGLESQAMILAAHTDTEFALLVPQKQITSGATVV